MFVMATYTQVKCLMKSTGSTAHWGF